jgi:hypothetical protein
MIYFWFMTLIKIQGIVDRILNPTNIFSNFPTSSFLSNIKLFTNFEFLREKACLALSDEEN